MPAWLRAYPWLLRVGLAEMFAYRAEFLVWALTTNMPLIMLAVWHAAADEAPIAGWGAADFTAYYLATMVVRVLTSNWVMWELNMEIRHGTLAMKLLRPIHPLLMYSAPQLAAVPMRIIVMSPLIGVLVWQAHDVLLQHDLSVGGLFLLSLAGSWLLQFLVMLSLGLMALFLESATGLFDVWLALHAVLGGYLVPLALYPSWARNIADWLPFRYGLSVPVEILVGRQAANDAVLLVGIQFAWVAFFLMVVLGLWRIGLRRFASFGG